MSKHEKFLEFQGNKMFFLDVNGTYWIALKPILDALNLESDRYLKKTKRDAFFSGCLDTMSIQVENNGIIQGRNMVCLPEKFIYGWICFLNSPNPDLIEYKKTCYELLYNHFHGTITNRKELLMEKRKIDTELYNLKQKLKEQDATFQKIGSLEAQKKEISKKLTNMDQEIIKQPEIF